MERALYSADIEDFLQHSTEAVLGSIAAHMAFDLNPAQRDAWAVQTDLLHDALQGISGRLYFEYAIPRMGKRIDAVLVIQHIVFVLEFKVGESHFGAGAIDQVWDYALDLKNFHETSHDKYVAPVLISTEAKAVAISAPTPAEDALFAPILASGGQIRQALDCVLGASSGRSIAVEDWAQGRYCPTPTIVEAARALYQGHSVHDISRSDAGAKNLHETTDAISAVIRGSKARGEKAICFVTGVPGAGKTLVGLNIATKHLSKDADLYSVFLSGNGPLVKVLQEALTRDHVAMKRERGERITKKAALSEVKAFIQNVHHYRDEYLLDTNPPVDHVTLFDEAQRAWDLEQTALFMAQKRKRPGFRMSEPDFLISCIDRHRDWGVIVCLVGGGQEINTGEAGISEWIAALNRSYPDWRIYISPRLTDAEFGAGKVLDELQGRPNVNYVDELHLAVSMRSFRAENVSFFVKQLLDLEPDAAAETLCGLQDNYPVVLTRSLAAAKDWLRKQARGSERYGIIVSSQAERLRPHAIDVRPKIDPVHWFLEGKDDVRSSYYLEDVATEFDIQGLELDWACVTWDADFRYSSQGWQNYSFKGSKWQNIKSNTRRAYQKNAYRVLLTRARQGMVIVVPEGDSTDPTRLPTFYDGTYDYLRRLGLDSC